MSLFIRALEYVSQPHCPEKKQNLAGIPTLWKLVQNLFQDSDGRRGWKFAQLEDAQIHFAG